MGQQDYAQSNGDMGQQDYAQSNGDMGQQDYAQPDGDMGQQDTEKAFALADKAALSDSTDKIRKVSDNKNQDYSDDQKMTDELDYSDSVNYEVPNQPTKRIVLD